MTVPFVDLQLQYASLKAEILTAVEGVMESAQFVLGKTVAEFEGRFAAAHRTRFCVGVGSGTEALHILLWAMEIGNGDEVVTVPQTFIATAEAISLTGARPVFVDIDPETYTMDPERLEQAITPRTKAILPVHLYGQPAAMDVILDVAIRNGVPVIEDACQAHLAQFDGRFVGEFGLGAAFSFYPGKNLGAYGEAGAVLTNDEHLHNRMLMLRDHGQTEKYKHKVPGLNYRLDALQAAILTVKLQHLKSWTDKRRAHAAMYRSLLEGVGDIVLPAENIMATHVYHLFVIQSGHRDALRAHMQTAGIATGLHYPVPLHLQEAYAFLGYAPGDFPVSEQVAAHGLSLPMFAELRADQIEHVCDTIRSFFD